GLLQPVYEKLRLLKRYQGVAIAVHDEGRRVVRTDKRDRRNLSRQLPQSLIVSNGNPQHRSLIEFPVIERSPESRLMIGGMDHLLALLAEIEEMGGGKDARDPLPTTGSPIHRFFGLRAPPAASRAQHERRVPSRRRAAHADGVGINSVVTGMMADKA